MNITTHRNYYPALDGIRGVAILLVVFFHNFGFLNYSVFGWLGVDLFFVLSGFLITDILLNTFGANHFLKNFYARRILRVFPLYYTSLIIFLLVLPNIRNLPVQMDYYVNHQIWLWIYLQNWLYVFHPPHISTLNHLWSLALEEQFYLVWPLIILLIKKPKLLLLFISVLLLLTVGMRIWVWFNKIEKLSYFNLYTFTRIDGICIGCMVALLQKLNSRFLNKYTSAIVVFFAALNFLFYFINKNNNDSFSYLAMVGYTTFAMLFGLLIYHIVNGSATIFSFIFNFSALKQIGRISYGYYIIHWPLYLMTRNALENWSRDNIQIISPLFFASFVASVAAYLLGYLSYHYFEMRFLKLKKHFIG